MRSCAADDDELLGSALSSNLRSQNGPRLLKQKATNGLPPSVPADLTGPGALHASLLNHFPHGVLIVDAKGKILYANPRSRAFFPVSGGFQAGLEAVAALACEAIKNRGRHTLQLTLPASRDKASSSPRVCQIIASPFAAAPMTSAWVIVRDITETLRQEKMREGFVEVAGEELTSPLSVIHGYVETLRGGRFKGPGAISLAVCLKAIEKHARRMMRLNDELAAVSARRSPRPRPGDEVFAVRTRVEAALRDLAGLIDKRQPVITLSFPADGGLLYGDPSRWEHVFRQIIENALQANEATGLHLQISGAWNPRECILCVADNGIGIPADEIGLVFESFFRCQNRPPPENGGCGLGLALVKQSVEAHDGRIAASSEPGRRTAFTMRVPLAHGLKG